MTMKSNNPVKMWWPTALTLAAVLWLTLAQNPTPDIEMPMLFPHVDKVVHAIMMGGLCGAAIFDYKRVSRPPRPVSRRFMVWLAVAMIVFSAADELAQSAMGVGRAGDVLDFGADLAGVAFAMLAAPTVCNALLPEK